MPTVLYMLWSQVHSQSTKNLYVWSAPSARVQMCLGISEKRIYGLNRSFSYGWEEGPSQRKHVQREDETEPWEGDSVWDSSAWRKRNSEFSQVSATGVIFFNFLIHLKVSFGLKFLYDVKLKQNISHVKLSYSIVQGASLFREISKLLLCSGFLKASGLCLQKET